MPTVASSSSARRKSPVPAIAAVLLAVACLAFFLLRKPQAAQAPAAPGEPSVAAEPVAGAGAAPAEGASQPADGNIGEPAGREAVAEPASGSTAKPRPKTPEELGLPIVDKEMKKAERRAFSSSTEQVISGYANTRRGFPPPPIIRLPMGENVEEILNRDIDIYDDDDPHIVEVKENCAALKQELQKYIADGGSAEEFLAWYHDELSRDYESWRGAQQYVVQLMREGLVDEADEYAAEKNAELEKAGIRKVVIPDNLRKMGEKKRLELAK